MKESSDKFLSFLPKAIPIATFFLVAIGIGFLLLVGRYDLALKFLYIGIPVGIASIIAVIKPGVFKKSADILVTKVSNSSVFFQYLVLLFVFLFVISACLLIVNEARPLSYFILMGLMAALILLEIFSLRETQSARKTIILIQITLIAANFIFGQTLRLPLYFGWGDILGHFTNIQTIIETGQVTSAMADYYYFPNFHIFGAATTLVSGFGLQTSYFVFYSLAFLVTIPLVYLLTSQLTHNTYLPLISALLYALSREIIFNGMYMTTRVMAFIICLLILYLLIRGKTDWKYRIMAVFLIIPLVLTHQSTLAHFSGILLILVVIEYILYHRSQYVGINYLLLFTCAYLGYWIWLAYPFISNQIVTVFAATSLTGVPETFGFKPLYTTFTGNADLMVLAFLIMIGVISLLYRRRELITFGLVFILFAPIAVIMYYPGANGLLSHLLLPYRLPLLVSPFIAFAAASGLLWIVQQMPTTWEHWKSIIKIGVSLIIVFFLTVSSAGILGNTTDVNITKLIGNEGHSYFTESEVDAFTFCNEYGRNLPYLGDYESLRYMDDHLRMVVKESFAEIIDPVSLYDGYLLFRNREFQSRGILTFATWVTATDFEQYYYTPTDNVSITDIWDQENKIFNNGALYIYVKEAAP
jgi:hypothetical protein